jgi:hypothetical protein
MSTITNSGTLTGTESAINEGEAIAQEVAGVAASSGVPIAGEASAVLTGISAVTQTVEAALGQHQSTLATAAAALKSAAASAPQVAGAVAGTAAETKVAAVTAQIPTWLSLIEEAIASIGSIL